MLPALGSLRYALANGVLLAAIFALSLGGWPVAVVLGLVLLLGVPADEGAGDQGGPQLTIAAEWFHNANLYATLPLLAGLTVAHWRLVESHEAVNLVTRFFPSLQAALPAPIFGRTANLVTATILVGYCYATMGATVAHELTHRTGSRIAYLAARGLLALMFNTAFTVFHLYGHHRYVATPRDPATAARGEYILIFLIRTTVQQFTEACRYEAVLLGRKGKPALSVRNRVLVGQAYSVAIVAGAATIAGWSGVLAFLAAAFIGRSLHESVNYVQHYGLVRAEGSAVQPHHTWDCDRIFSNALHYNLPRHSNHHMTSSRPFWELETSPSAPRLPHGYQTMVLLALLPPLWWRVMVPLLAEWDRRFASEEERAIIRTNGWSVASDGGFTRDNGVVGAR